MKITPFTIPSLLIIEPKVHRDKRGYFFELYNKNELLKNNLKFNFVQDCVVCSSKGVIRGLHFQRTPKAQAKLVTALKGEIFDVAADIRKNSPTYGKWIGEILSESNHKLLYIPEGFAHGFCVLSEEADVLYKVSNEYSSEHEEGIIWSDPKLNIQWPITKPIVSDKDGELPLLEN